MLAEIRALRSEITAVKTKQAEIILNQSRQHENTATTDISQAYVRGNADNDIVENNRSQIIENDRSSRPLQTERNLPPNPIRDRSPITRPLNSEGELNVDPIIIPQYGYELPPFVQNQSGIRARSTQEVQDTGAGKNSLNNNCDVDMHNIRNSHTAPTNPFIPPPIKSSILKKIEKREYVDFEDLLPSAPSRTNTQAVDTFIDVDLETSALKLRSHEKKEKVGTFSAWMTACNT